MSEPRDAADRSSRRSVLSGSVRATTLTLALPVLAEQVLSFLVGFVDTKLSGYISPGATSAIGVGAYVGWLASLLFSLVATGTTALVARAWGEGDYATANRVTNRSIALVGCMGFAMYGAIWFAAPILADLLRMGPETHQITVRYLRLDGFGHLFTSVAFVGSAALRGAGEMRWPMIILGAMNVVNLIVSVTCVFGLGPIPPLGVDGIVLGTVTARMFGGVVMLVGLTRGLSGLKLRRSEIRLRGQTSRRILRIGGPAALDGSLMWGGQFLFLMIISALGQGQLNEDVFAAHIICIRVEAITYLPAVAWGYAAATLVGQSLGAGDPRRAEHAGHEATWQCCLPGLVITLVFYFGAEAIYALMHESSAVVAVGAAPFRIVALFQIPLIISITYVHALKGAGDTRFPLYITLLSVLGVRLPVAYVCGVIWEGGLLGAWLGMCGDMGVRGVLAMVRFTRAGWVQTKV